MRKPFCKQIADLEPVMTFADIAIILGISRQRVEMIYRRAIFKMRAASNRRELQELLAEKERRRVYAVGKRHSPEARFRDGLENG